MVRKGVIVALGVLASQAVLAGSPALAETAAVLDASGRIVPVRSQPAKASGPCGSAAALPVESARALVARVAAEESFYPEFVLSVAKIESRYNSTALSEKGAFGLMQLTPETAQRFAVDLCDPEGNVRGGIRFLRALHERYRNPLFILAAYNAGEEPVRRSRGVPPFPETVRFVADVLNDFYAWPGAANGPGMASAGPRTSAKVASAALPDVVEIEPPRAGKPATALSSSGPRSAAPAAGPSWNDGFVMHVD